MYFLAILSDAKALSAFFFLCLLIMSPFYYKLTVTIGSETMTLNSLKVLN